MDDWFSFGEWIRRRRKALDLTQTELACCAGCAVVTIRKIESDALRPSRQIAERLASCLTIPSTDQPAFLQAARAQRSVDRLGSPLAGALSSPAATHTRRTNVPLQLTSFVGRERELAELTQLLATNRLVTLTGIGGTGKTRLALEAANAALATFPDGGWFVELAPIGDAWLIPQAVAAVLGVPEQADRPMPATLNTALHDKQLLLILDNCEYHAASCAELINTLLISCASVRVLATSREPLHLLGEQLYPLSPLGTPSPHSLRSLEDLMQVESVRLFCDRARAAQPRFALTPANAPAIAAICQRLDGLPLAIELAAAHIRRFPPQTLLERLCDPLAALVAGPRNLPQRHQTLRATIDWSYQLLDAHEQRFFACLGVFAGGWTMAAAEAVWHTGADGEAVLADALATLLDKSLVRQFEDRNGEPRCGLLETIRAYALDQLRTNAFMETVCRRHAEYYVSFVERAEQELSGAQSSIWMDRLDQEHENLRAALSWALAAEGADTGAPRLELALRLCGVLWRFWWVRGHLSEGRHWIEAALARPGAAAPDRRAKVLHGAGVLARAQGDLGAAETFLGEGLALWKSLGDTIGVARGLNSLGVVCFNRQEFDRALELFQESLVLYRELDDTPSIATILNNLGNIAYKQGDLQRAAAYYTEGLELLQGHHTNRQKVALIKANLGEIARGRKDYIQAVRLLHESATLYHQLNEVEGMLLCLNTMADVAIDQLYAELAAHLLGVADGLYERIGAVRSPEQANDYERQVAAARGQLSPGAFTAALSQGYSTPVDQILAQAIDEMVTQALPKGEEHGTKP